MQIQRACILCQWLLPSIHGTIQAQREIPTKPPVFGNTLQGVTWDHILFIIQWTLDYLALDYPAWEINDIHYILGVH